MPLDVGGAAQAELDHACGHRGVGEAIDQDERAGVGVLRVGIESDRLGDAQIARPGLVELKRFARNVVEIVDVELVFET